MLYDIALVLYIFIAFFWATLNTFTREISWLQMPLFFASFILFPLLALIEKNEKEGGLF